MRGYFTEGFDPEGAGIEGDALRQLRDAHPHLPRATPSRRAGHPEPFGAGGLPGQQRWFAHEVLPGGGAVNPLNDARYYEINPTFTTWQSSFGADPQLSRWLFDEMTRKIPGDEPQPRRAARHPALVRAVRPRLRPGHPLPAGRGLRGPRPRPRPQRLGTRTTCWPASTCARPTGARACTRTTTSARSPSTATAPSSSPTAATPTGSTRPWPATPTLPATSECEGHNLVVADGRSQDFFGKGDLVGFATTASVGRPGHRRPRGGRPPPGLADPTSRPGPTASSSTCGPGPGRPTTWWWPTASRRAAGRTPTPRTCTPTGATTATVAGGDPGSVRIDSGEVPGVGLDVDVHAAAPIATGIGIVHPRRRPGLGPARPGRPQGQRPHRDHLDGPGLRGHRRAGPHRRRRDQPAGAPPACHRRHRRRGRRGPRHHRHHPAGHRRRHHGVGPRHPHRRPVRCRCAADGDAVDATWPWPRAPTWTSTACASSPWTVVGRRWPPTASGST